MSGSYCPRNRQTCSKLHILYIICLKCLPPVCTKISDVDELNRHISNQWAGLNYAVIECDIAPASTPVFFNVFIGMEPFGVFRLLAEPT